MRHRKAFNHLSRTASHRKAMLSNMASSLILHKRIKTTLAKAKALRRYVEPILTRAKDDTTHSRRMVFSYLQNKESVQELFSVVADKISHRPGGYTRIIRLGNRLGDNAEVCMMELVDFNTTLVVEKKKETGKTSRRRRKKKSGSNPETSGEATPQTQETPQPLEAKDEGKEAPEQVETQASVEEVADTVKEKTENNEASEPQASADADKTEDAEEKSDDSKEKSE